MTRVGRSILICFVARSGSWFLCGLLASTGVLGRPEEFFWAPDDRVADPALDEVLRRGTTPNGVFACKFQLGQWRVLLDREQLRRRGADRELIERTFPNPLYVWLQREDRISQAVSWARAVQTRQWRTQDVRRGEPSYDASLIAGLIELIGWETHGWRAWFDAQRVEPLVVTYEELLADRAAAVCRIAEAAGVALPDVVPLHPYPGRERQADELNEDWARRYRTEVGA